LGRSLFVNRLPLVQHHMHDAGAAALIEAKSMAAISSEGSAIACPV
jgi:hypothetical protein